jgi:hypothetical protein
MLGLILELNVVFCLIANKMPKSDRSEEATHFRLL